MNLFFYPCFSLFSISREPYSWSVFRVHGTVSSAVSLWTVAFLISLMFIMLYSAALGVPPLPNNVPLPVDPLPSYKVTADFILLTLFFYVQIDS